MYMVYSYIYAGKRKFPCRQVAHACIVNFFAEKNKYGSTNYLRNTRITLKQIYNSSGNFEIAVFVW